MNFQILRDDALGVNEGTKRLEDSVVQIGAIVTLRLQPDAEPASYRLVGDGETDLPAGRLSVSTPLAQALLGRKEGDEVSVDAPGGTRTCHILKVRAAK